MVGSGSVGAQVNDIAIQGFVLYVATPSGLAILTLDDPENPARPAGAPQFVGNTANATGVSVSEGHAYVACGTTGIMDVDARTVANPKAGVNIAPQAVDVRDVAISEIPGQRWVLALENNGDLVGVKLDRRKALQEKCYPDPKAADCLLDMIMYDPTRSSRDPSFDPLTQTFDANDPSGQPFFRMTGNILANGRKLARATPWEQINTLTGRRFRDSFVPGAGTISLPVMQTMRAVQVCELGGADAANSTNPSGLDQLGYFVGGDCVPFGSAARPAPHVCKPGMLGPGLKRIVCPPSDVITAKASPPPARPSANVTRAARSAARR
jgi:hypothetical protein